LARGRTVLVCACALAALGSLPAAGGARAAGGCDLFAASNGRDRASGRAGTPVRTLGRLIAGLRAGQTGCVEPGTRFDEHLVVASGGASGKPARIQAAGSWLNGVAFFTRDAHDLVLDGLHVQGDGSAVDAIVRIHGPGITLSHVEVNGPNYHDANVACIRLGGKATGVTLSWVVVHECTRARRRNLYAPGIVVAHARRTRIIDSTVYHTIGDAIVLGPDARGTRITRTVIDRNSNGIYISGRSSGNVISNNTISFSGRYGVHGDGGTGNVVTSNCIYRGYTKDIAGRGFRAHGNLHVGPRYLTLAPSYQMRPGPCASRHPGARAVAVPALPRPQPVAAPKPKADAKPRPQPKPKPKPKAKPKPKPRPPAHLDRFVVHYTLSALPRRVQIVSLTFTGLAPGATLKLSCRRGCNSSEQIVAASNGTATSAVFLGVSLRRGAVIVARERRGRATTTASIIVTGLPRGVRITHP
jgi:parallel beta-helix repeat protein